MKIVFVLFALGVIATGSLAQKEKGDQCVRNEECIQDVRNMRCVQNYCGCRKGERQEEESHSDGSSQYICSEVVGKGCEKDENCSIDLDKSRCVAKLCVCNKEDGCISRKNKGEECQADDECINDTRRMKCVNYHCGCKKGQRQELKSGELVCTNVVGLGCTRDNECYSDLDKATCNLDSQVCECKKENGCSGASTMTIISFLSMIFLSLGLIKSW